MYWILPDSGLQKAWNPAFFKAERQFQPGVANWLEERYVGVPDPPSAIWFLPNLF